jgi:glycosyltransferase involved in cell wall biosynthesis
MKVLFLSPYVPRVVLHGGHDRTLALLRGLSRFASLEVLAIDATRADEPRARDPLSALDIPLAVYPPTGPGPHETRAEEMARLPDAMCQFRSRGLREALERRMLEDPPDVTHFEELVMAQYVDSAWTARVIARHRVEFLYHEAMATRPTTRAPFHRQEAARLKRCEAELAGRFERVLVVGESDAQALAPVWGRDRTRVVPLSIGDSIRRPDGRSLAIDRVFLSAATDPAASVEALQLYFREVWPALRIASALRTVVIGSGRRPVGLGRADDRVEVGGSIPDLAAEPSHAGVLLIPPRAGGPGRARVQAALAAGVPLVSTQAGVEGLGLEAGRDYLRAETADELLAAVLRLARQPALVTQLSRNGAWFVDARFRGEALSARIEGVFREALRSFSMGRRLPRRIAFLRRTSPPRVESWLRSHLRRDGLPFKALRALKRAAAALHGRLHDQARPRSGR